jgi:3alpha(or 20beta)-hydroxysteroid dehydrogenase
LNVTSEVDWRAAVDFAVATYGRLDILINNAAVLILRIPIEEREVEEWGLVMGVNAKDVFLGTKVAIPAMRAGGGGSIVNISSIAGIGQSTTREPAYAANKGAIWVFSRVTATQHGKDNICCNSVHPGHVYSEMFRATFSTPEALAERLSRVPMRRAGLVDEIVAGVIYLASDESSYVTGTELVIDGGALSMWRILNVYALICGNSYS